MRIRTMRFALLGVMTAGVVLTQQACANGTAVEPVSAPAASEAATTEAEPAATGSEAPESPDPDEGAVPACKTGDLEANITLQPDGKGDTRMGLVTLTNKSDTECGVHGHATIALKNPADEVVNVPTENVKEPGESIRTALKSGSSVYQGIKWTVCDKGDSTCGAGNTLVFSLDGGKDGKPAKLSNFPAPEKNDITMKSLKIGTIQPDRQGVVAW
ncbi:DUF4232 domain-containing protein [Actinoplanes couchii]|uniref:DUF4232 domain-containing protein n=1 Tax=Actinoplanes couchii TaxID=403638 RepID=A0ABQ3XNB4_9ACTN|nr:DUF4232 domain-containing protein [Actinoplanes couchii]MDR6318086.1 hypothetical protein [Actinoplanes couchii]GID59998.1 hypothetical protein Aco03nite_084020 [Actinoplanes couchii]